MISNVTITTGDPDSILSLIPAEVLERVDIEDVVAIAEATSLAALRLAAGRMVSNHMGRVTKAWDKSTLESVSVERVHAD